MIHNLHNEGHKVKKLHTLLHSGIFAVPKLQRVFVWNGPKAAKLIDSVYRSMPIGALTVWDAPRAQKNILRTSLTVLPEFKEANTRVWFLLDGQQRLSVLHRVFEGGIVTNGFKAIVDFARVVFRVTEGEDTGRFQYRKPDHRTWVSVTDVLATNWKTRLSHLTTGQQNRVDTCRRRIMEYEVPIVRAEMDDIEEARELFIRINASGTPLAAADRAFARAARFDLREMAAQSLNKLPKGFQGLSNEVILQTRALLDDVQDLGVDAMSEVVDLWNKAITADANQIKVFQRKWDGQHAAMGRALDLLYSEFCVLNASVLPYTNMVSTLSTFYADCPRRPTAEQLKEIRKWFWGTALAKRYSGSGYRKHILDDVRFFRNLAAGANEKFKLDELIDPADIKRATYGKRSSISDALYCLLIQQQPIYLGNGRPMQVSDFAGAANKKHKHHIFPQKFLREQGVGKVGLNSILNLCFISAEENSQFGSQPPAQYLAPFKDTRIFGRAMAKHLIPVDSKSGVWRSDRSGYLAFIKQREQTVCKAFEAASGTKLFRKDST